MVGRPYVETLVFVGGIAADVRAFVPEHPGGEIGVSWGSEGRLSAGGRAASAAAAAVKLGRKFVDLVGCVGADMLGESIVQSLREVGVTTRLVDRIDGASTGIQQVVVDVKGDRRMVGVPNANWQCGEPQLRKADSTVLGADMLYATLEVPLPTVRRAVATAKSRNVPVLLDATPVPTAVGDEVLDRTLLGDVDVLLANWTSARLLADMPMAAGPVAVELGKRLLRLGPKAVVITMGEHGAMVAVRGQHALVEPYAVRVVDASFAGDAFAGALVVGLTSQARGNWRWEQVLSAANFASAAAAVCVGRPGGLDSLPTRDEVERMLTSRPQRLRG